MSQITSSKEGQLLLYRISGITENFMQDNARCLETRGFVSGSRKEKYISDLSRLIGNSRASHSDKNRIMDGIGLLPNDKINILAYTLTREDSVGMKVEITKTIYVTIVENFDKIKEIAFSNEHMDISSSHNTFLRFIRIGFDKGLDLQKQIDKHILEGCKGLHNKKKDFNDVYQQYIVLYHRYMNMQIESVCSTVVLNDDVKNLIYGFI